MARDDSYSGRTSGNAMMFAVDYPRTQNQVVRDWFDRLDLTPSVRERIAHGTADRLLRLH